MGTPISLAALFRHNACVNSVHPDLAYLAPQIPRQRECVFRTKGRGIPRERAAIPGGKHGPPLRSIGLLASRARLVFQHIPGANRVKSPMILHCRAYADSGSQMKHSPLF